MKDPLVSIIIPVYNGSDYLRESIDSALAQTYKNLEVIVVNDGSNDDCKTEEIALSYKNKITYYANENGGVSSALNTGIKNMNGEYFSWLSHDDLYYPNKISEQVELLNKNNTSNIIVNCSYEVIDEEGNPITTSRRKNKAQKMQYEPHEAFKMLFSGGNFNGCALLVPKKAIRENRLFDENLAFIQDWKMWVLLSLDNYMFLSVNKPLIKMRVHSNRQTLKIKDLHPIESKDCGIDLFNDLYKDFDENIKQIKIIMMWAARNQYDEVVDYIFATLKNSKQYNFGDHLIFISSKMYIQALSFTKRKVRKVSTKIRYR